MRPRGGGGLKTGEMINIIILNLIYKQKIDRTEEEEGISLKLYHNNILMLGKDIYIKEDNIIIMMIEIDRRE